MIEVVIAGAAGRMGKRLVRAAAGSNEVVVEAAFERQDHPFVGEDAGVAAGIGVMGVPISASLDEAVGKGKVLIDFTVPEASMKHLHAAAEKGVAAVVGTTGFSAEMLADIREMSRRIACVLSPNMSVGMNIMFKAAGELAAALGHGYDLEIVETHHRLKKDAPSGTAMRLAEVLAGVTGRNIEEAGVYARKGIIGARSEEEIGVQSLRGGDVTGEHSVFFLGIGERLELTHRAHNRDNFAHGALRAAVWVVDRPAGLYDMQDVLGLRQR
ncbi:MAG TPA: 4-hydroxy-tetrahydrodipicolinate reductase [Desulfobacteraceae bacterium]|nr:4-hydroxy-tetrahydrodipicolinate reductase [Desulfobacteraceae bacterium]